MKWLIGSDFIVLSMNSLAFKIVFCTLFFKTQAIERLGWSAWSQCASPLFDCTRHRFKICNSAGRTLNSVLCVDQGEKFNEQITGIFCSTICNSENVLEHIACGGGACYDSFRTEVVQCNSGCFKTTSYRCYEPETCASSWVNVGPETSCSKSCGGGIRTQLQRCFLEPVVERHISYNCRESGGDITAVKQITSRCNTERCPSWSPWSITKCSVSCETGTRQRTSTCIYMGRPSRLCNEETTRLIRTEVCENGPCGTEQSDEIRFAWLEWSQCSVTCTGSVGNRKRIRMPCHTSDNGTSCANIETEPCTSNASCHRCMENIPCVEWGPWEMVTNCSTTKRIISIRHCLSLWNIQLTDISCPNHLYYRNSSCIIAADQPAGLSWAFKVGISVAAVMTVIVILAVVYMLGRKNVTKKATQLSNNSVTYDTPATSRTNSQETSGLPSPLPTEPGYEEARETTYTVPDRHDHTNEHGYSMVDNFPTARRSNHSDSVFYTNASSYMELEMNTIMENTSCNYLRPIQRQERAPSTTTSSQGFTRISNNQNRGVDGE